MQALLLTIHLLIALAIIGVVLLQRSEGGGLGIGGGGNAGFMTGRGSANILTRITTILGICFFITSLALTLIVRYGNEQPLLDILPEGESAPSLPLLEEKPENPSP